LTAVPLFCDALSSSDVLPDSTAFGVVVPPNWNGTLLLDLDFLTGWRTPTYQALFAQGYAGAGTTRNYTDPVGGQYIRPWMDRILTVADHFATAVAAPKRIIAWGVSRGGHVALALALLHPARVDGAIPRGIYGGAASLMNQDLDLMFSLKALLAPDDDRLPLVNLSNGPATPAPIGLEPGLSAWNEVVIDAQSSAQGRARLALAAAIAQLPDWVDASVPRPARSDAQAIADGWARNIRARIGPTGTFSFMRPAFETSAGGNFSWNVGVEYGHLLEGRRREIVQRLYVDAGLDLEGDLDAVDSATRIKPDPGATWFVRDPSVNYGGELRVPVLTAMTIGDALLPVSGLGALRAAVRRGGGEDMLRMTFTETVGHCIFSLGEDLALVETMRRRLDTGHWADSTSPDAMNGLAAQFDPGAGRFIDYELEHFERGYLLGDPFPEVRLDTGVGAAT
jgi:pimeloyl-ACP methyl ester carboxylesterase